MFTIKSLHNLRNPGPFVQSTRNALLRTLFEHIAVLVSSSALCAPIWQHDYAKFTFQRATYASNSEDNILLAATRLSHNYRTPHHDFQTPSISTTLHSFTYSDALTF